MNADREIFPELLQEDFNIKNLMKQCEIIENKKEDIVSELKKEREKLGEKGVLSKIADYMIEKINGQNGIKN